MIILFQDGYNPIFQDSHNGNVNGCPAAPFVLFTDVNIALGCVSYGIAWFGIVRHRMIWCGMV